VVFWGFSDSTGESILYWQHHHSCDTCVIPVALVVLSCIYALYSASSSAHQSEALLCVSH